MLSGSSRIRNHAVPELQSQMTAMITGVEVNILSSPLIAYENERKYWHLIQNIEAKKFSTCFRTLLVLRILGSGSCLSL
jgi:hypothetical protein